MGPSSGQAVAVGQAEVEGDRVAAVATIVREELSAIGRQKKCSNIASILGGVGGRWGEIAAPGEQL